MRVLLFIFLSVFFHLPAHAACTQPDRSEGQIVYNQDWGVFQGCTPMGWVRFNQPTASPVPTGCPNIGDVCTGLHAGMIYAADFEGHKLYIAAGDAPENKAWGPSFGASGMELCASPYTEDACKTGKENTQFLKDIPSIVYPPAEYCANLSAHGYGAGKWYLPSRNELGQIYTSLKGVNRLEASNFTTTGTGFDGYYWSSSEGGPSNAYVRDFSGTYLNTTNKSGVHRVRCVWR